VLAQPRSALAATLLPLGGARRAAELTQSSSVAEESFSNIAVVKVRGYERQEGRRYGAQLQQLVALGYRTLAAYSVRLECLPGDGCLLSAACTSC
jgi:ABC-type multidrug transport system fused ATPase/permease subunit